MFKNHIKINLIELGLFILISALTGQNYIPADPFNLLFIEKEAFDNNNNFGSLTLRPNFYAQDTISMEYRTELFYNTNAPNLENMSDRWIGKETGFFSSINLSYRNKFILGSIEPYYFIDQNTDYDVPVRIPLFSQLNDNNSHHEKSPYQNLGLREFQLYLHWHGIGAGIANANMWWGPGIHSSIMMTNNASGFTHFSMGTLEEKRIKNWGFIGRYIFSKFDDRNKYEPYYASVIFCVTYYSDPIVSVGFTKAALNGGTYSASDDVKWYEAALTIFSGFTAGDLKTYKKRWSYDDNTVAAYISTYFPNSKLTLFLEFGRNDITWDLLDLILAPDHSLATNFGFRKYGIFNNDNLFFGMEYLKLLGGRYLDRLKNTGPWYNRLGYEFSSFNGRHFGAHSGPDSDDFYVYGGWQNNKLTIIPSFNYERHGVQEPAVQSESSDTQDNLINYWPETKIEFRFDFRYQFKDYKFNFYMEQEFVRNYEFRDKKRSGTVFWTGVEKSLNTSEIVKKIRGILTGND